MRVENKSFGDLREQLEEERKKVDVASHNFSTRELSRMMLDEEIDIAPAYQRKFRWTEEGESLFIESVFLGLPIPPVFVATNKDFGWEVVDGLQRLSTLLHFMARDGDDLSIIDRAEPLKLTGLGKLDALNDVRYAELPKNIQVYFGRQPIQVVSLTDKSNKLIRFDLFERLNTGGVELSPQEVRACVFRGPFSDLVVELAENPTFRSLLKLQKAHQNDGTFEEQVLKFFAYKNKRGEFNGQVSKFLNKFTESANESFDVSREKELFKRTVDRLSEICGGDPFLRSRVSTTPLVQFEACMVAVAEILDEGREPADPGAGWPDDKELVRYSTRATNMRNMLEGRIRRARELFSADA